MSNDLIKTLGGWLLASIVGGLLAVTLGWVNRPVERAPAIAPGAAAADPALAARIAELSGQIEALHRFLATREPPRSDLPDPERIPVGEIEAPEWIEDLRALTRALQRQGTRVAGGSEVSMSEMATWAPTRGLQPLFGPYADYRNEEFDWSAADDFLTREHVLWSVEDLVRHYGLPDEVNGLNQFGLVISYKDPQTDLLVMFRTRDGLVFSADLDD